MLLRGRRGVVEAGAYGLGDVAVEGMWQCSGVKVWEGAAV